MKRAISLLPPWLRAPTILVISPAIAVICIIASLAVTVDIIKDMLKGEIQ